MCLSQNVHGTKIAVAKNVDPKSDENVLIHSRSSRTRFRILHPFLKYLFISKEHRPEHGHDVLRGTEIGI